MLFSGHIPHRSANNCTDKARRAIFLTYNPASQGNHHDKYYEAKQRGVQGFDKGHAISFIDDFNGKIVD